MIGPKVGAREVFRLRNNVCYVKMASTDTAVWRNEGMIKIPNVSKYKNKKMAERRRNGGLPWSRPDSKTQVD